LQLGSLVGNNLVSTQAKLFQPSFQLLHLYLTMPLFGAKLCLGLFVVFPGSMFDLLSDVLALRLG